MKKFLFITCTALVMLSACAYPRQTNNAMAAGKIRTSPKNQFLNDIHIRAVRDFVSMFGDVPDVIWHKSGKHYIAVFIHDSVQTRVIYNLNGILEYTMKYYEEPKMRRDVRTLVKSTYFDYKIFIVQEIQRPDDQPVYIVNLQGDTEWMKVKVYNGEMEVMEKFKRGRK